MLQTKDLTIQFGGLTAVNAVNIDIRDNTVCGLIGPNGAGKTTCFNLLSGVYKPTKGTVEFDGRDVTGLRPYQINHAGMSRTYQAIHLFTTMTVEENALVGVHPKLHTGLPGAILRLPKQRAEEKAAREKVRELLEFVGLYEKKDVLASELPYGEQRLLEIVRGMASDPKLLLLDEPAAGMNATEKVELTETIRKIRDRGITILLVEHDMRLVMDITDDIYVLNYGKLIAHGTPEEIQNNPDVIAAYLGGDED